MEKKHLGQINTVFRDALALHQEKVSAQPNQKSGYELTVEFGCKSSSDTNKRTLNTGEVLSRKNTFQENLLDLTKKHHQVLNNCIMNNNLLMLHSCTLKFQFRKFIGINV